MAEDVLRLEGIVKSYGVGTPAAAEVLHGIDLRLRHGEFVALMGPSGSGKSTLLNIIGLLDRPSGGTLYVGGRDTAALGDKALTRLRGHSIGFVFQYHYLLSAFTALENVMMPALLERGRPDRAMREHALQLLTHVGLAPWCDNKANNLSGGQQQRVAIARALAGSPKLLLADEPTGNLDTQMARGVMELLEEINAAGTTILMVTHDPELAVRTTRNVHIIDGQVSDLVRKGPSLVQTPVTA